MAYIQLPISASNPDGSKTANVLDVSDSIIIPNNVGFLILEGSFDLDGAAVDAGSSFAPRQTEVTLVGIGKVGLIQ